MNEKRRSSDRGVVSWAHNPVSSISLILTVVTSLVVGTSYINKVAAKSESNEEAIGQHQKLTELALKEVKNDVKGMRDEINSDLREIRRDIKLILKELK